MNKLRSHSNIWNQCLDIIKDNVTESAYNTWFSPVMPLNYEDNKFTIQVPSQFFYEYLEEQYADLIHATLSRVTNKDIILSYRVIVDNSSRGKNGHTTLQSERPHSAPDYKKNATKLNEVPDALIQKSAQEWNSNLNKRLCFHNFFEGSSNKLARSIGERIALDPETPGFNPLFIYGNSGVGKTHLCHAIGNKIEELFPQKKVVYISSHLFQVQFTDASRKNIANDFINFYQGVDILIVDDIQELAGKVGTQNAYFHIFNHLQLLGKRIILTSDRIPKEIGLEERLISRFNSGMTAELLSPDFELRKQILNNKIKQDGLNISEEIVDYIAKNVTDHVRNLEGIITSLVAYSLVYNREVDLELAKRVVEKIVKQEKKQITVEKIQSVVSSYFKIDLDQIQSKSRKREIVQARQVTMFLSKKYTDYSYSHIGSLVGKRDHATVLHACKTIQNDLEIDKGFRLTMKNIEDMLQK